MPGIEFFDVDHTITRHSSGGRFISLAIRRGVIPGHLLFLLPWYTLTYRLGVFHMQEFEAGFPYLRGIRRKDLDDLARESFQTALLADLFPDVEALVRRLLAEGRRVALATSSLDIIVAPLAEHLGVTEVLATALEFKNGECTGRLAGAPMFRGVKKDRVLEYAAAQGADPAACSFHSDSVYDLPLLEAVGRPVAVNPDWRLRRMALARGWPVMEVRSRPGRAPATGRPRT
jgi:HAD superfamily hydrolase (TIGR01490 family)